MNNIIDLRETSPNNWRAKYQGNYGVYTIKINTDGKRRGSFSCSCPSDNYPCKHIAMVEEAIAQRIAKNAGNRKNGKAPKMSVEELLKKLTREELYDFLAGMTKNDPDLTGAVFLKFSEKVEDEGGNKYVSIIRRALANCEFDESDYYNKNTIYIDVLDDWVEKAEQLLKDGRPREAVLIAQAYIEEFADWLQETVDDNLIDRIPDTYQSRPFSILKKAVKDPQINDKELSDYCMAEVSKEKYADFYMVDCFNDLLMILSATVNPGEFINLQHDLLDKIQDKSSYEAEIILERIVDFYKKCRQSKKAWQYVEENIQIDTFRQKVVEKKIKQKKFAEAKKLVHDYIDTQEDKSYFKIWDDYLLQIAQGEEDIPTIRTISYSFIKDNFDKRHYEIYKSAFSAGEWAEAFENLLRHYETKKSFWGDPAADLLVAEGKAERLMEYIGKRISLEKIEKYYTFFSDAFPEKTLALFRKALDHYVEENTGRGHYEHIIDVFKKMKKIPGGDALTADMKAQYLVKYKNRRAMVEILSRPERAGRS
jgi:hypothetical protein